MGYTNNALAISATIIKICLKGSVQNGGGGGGGTSAREGYSTCPSPQHQSLAQCPLLLRSSTVECGGTHALHPHSCKCYNHESVE